MQATGRDQTEKEIFVVVGNSGCHDPAPTLACWPVHAQAPRVEPFSGTKGNPRSTQVGSCCYVAVAHRTCSGSLGPRSHRCGGNSGAPIPSAIIIAISLALNAAIYVGIGLILWTFGEVFSRFFQRRSPN